MTKGEIALVLALVLVLLIARRLLCLSGIPRGSEHFGLGVWLAQGLGVGLFPVAPGTLGSVLGVGWFACLITTGHLWIFLVGTLAGLALSVWLCGEAETALGRKDPSSVVLDEISSMPVCFLFWVLLLVFREGSFPGLEAFFSRTTWPATVGIFAAFRFFDVIKPWPVRQSQALPGGWGITVDDALAALYVTVRLLLAYGLRFPPFG